MVTCGTGDQGDRAAALRIAFGALGDGVYIAGRGNWAQPLNGYKIVYIPFFSGPPSGNPCSANSALTLSLWIPTAAMECIV